MIDAVTLLTLPWDAARALEDTPALRSALWNGYRQLHDASSRKNPQAYLDVTDQMFLRIAYVLGYSTPQDVAVRI